VIKVKSEEGNVRFAVTLLKAKEGHIVETLEKVELEM